MSQWNPGDALTPGVTLRRRIGAGGMGDVWLAFDAGARSEIAVKLVDAGDQRARGLLEREYHILRELDHPCIVRVHGLIVTPRAVAMCMETIAGDTLCSLQGAPWRQILRVALPVADCLIALHERGLVHRDLKCSNILVDTSGRPRLADFGMASTLYPSSGMRHPRGGGTPHTMSPQQQADAAPEPADDVYAFGALLRDLVFGGPRPAHPGLDCGPVPRALGTLIRRMTAQSPSLRPPDMRSVRDELGTLYNGPHEHGIEPPAVQGHGARDRDVKPGSGPGPRGTAVALLILAALLLLGVWEVWKLPELVQETRQPEAPAATGAQTGPPAASSNDLTTPDDDGASTDPLQAARDRRQSLRDALARLERSGLADWDPQAHEQAGTALDKAQKAYMRGDLPAAMEIYGQVASLLQALQSRRSVLASAALDEGRGALGAGEPQRAADALQRAAGLDPDNTEIPPLLAQAQRAARLQGLLEEGRRLMAAGDLEGAQAEFARALELDPHHAPAAEALEAARSSLEDLQFGEAMSEGFNALARDDLAGSRASFDRAAALRPGDPAVREARNQVDEREFQAGIRQLVSRARRLESGEDWSAAARAWQKALGMDPSLAPARTALARDRELARIGNTARAYLARPERLASREVYDEAMRFHAEAVRIQDKGQRLQRALSRLSSLLQRAATPRTVIMESDNMTDVVIYKVGRLGRFASRQIELRPGSYTVVGTRDGYRDVRLRFTVDPDRPAPKVVVRCEEPV